MKIGCWEVPKPTYPSLLWLAEWKAPAPLFEFPVQPLVQMVIMMKSIRSILRMWYWWPWFWWWNMFWGWTVFLVCYILERLHELDNYLVSVGIWGSLNFIQIMSRGHCYYHMGRSLKRASNGQFSCDIVHFTYECFWISSTKLTLKGCTSL